MSILIHLIASIILALLLFAYFGWYSMLVFVGGVLIDVDHYLSYVIKFKIANIFKSYFYFRKREFFGIFCVFHSLELLFVLVIISLFSKIVWLITIGLFVHYILDFIYELNLAGRLIKNWSLVLWVGKKLSKLFFSGKPKQ